MTPRFCDSEILAFFLSSTIIYEPILIFFKYMKANIGKTQIFHKMKYDLKGLHSRSQKMTFYLKIHVCYWLIEAMNAAKHYERTKTTFDLHKDNIWLEQRWHLTCTKKTFDLYKNNIWLVQRRHLTCTKTTFDLYKGDIGLAYV